MNSHSAFIRYQNAMNKVAAMCVDLAATSIAEKTAPSRTIESATTTLVHGFTEISTTLDRLNLIDGLFSVAAPRSKSIEKHEYMNFLIGVYLQEVYILEQRLTAYATRMGRAYRTGVNVEELFESIQQTLGKIVKTRGAHVHVKRYSDERLEILSGITYIGELAESFHINATAHCKTVQREWQKTIKSNRAATLGLVNSYFSHLLSAITKDGLLFLPRTGREPHGPTIALDA